MAIATACLITLDTITGVIAVFIEKKPRTSAAFARVLAKAFAYLSVCVVAAIVDKTIFKGVTLPVVNMDIPTSVLVLMIATESISVLENVERISGGRFRWLRSLLGKIVENDKVAAEKEKETNV